MSKLTLRKETIALLNPQALHTVAGGVSDYCTNMCPSEHSCPTDCLTCDCPTTGTGAPSNGTRCTACQKN